jgi:AmiR/NasT family two-component response regulator
MHSILSIRLTLDNDAHMAGLNLYSRRSHAFDEDAENVAQLLATHAGAVVSRQLARDKVTNLEVALASNREIGVAMGVLMTTYKITRDEAFDLLRIASQNGHRKLREIAIEVGDTGTLAIA